MIKGLKVVLHVSLLYPRMSPVFLPTVMFLQLQIFQRRPCHIALLRHLKDCHQVTCQVLLPDHPPAFTQRIECHLDQSTPVRRKQGWQRAPYLTTRRSTIWLGILTV